MIKQYRNKKWLENKYSEEILSIFRISKLCKVANETIYKWMKRHNIPRRSLSEAIHLGKANHCKLSQEAIEWISGELLGDGNLRSQSYYSAQFAYSSQYPEYVNYISDTLNSFGIKRSGKIRRRINKDKENFTYTYSSLCYVELLPMYKRWYPKNKKVIPKYLRLTPLTCRQHYIGDGCLSYRKNGRPYIILCTDGFPISNVEWLVKQINKIGFKATKMRRNRIRISAYSTENFLNYMGKCPVKCYQYKFSY
jgi:predicted DNA-binding transcriptional regulator AlpA